MVVWIILAVVILLAVLDIMLMGYYGTARRQLRRFDRKNSELDIENVLDFINGLKAITNMGISGVSLEGNEVAVTCQGTAYLIDVSSGTAVVRYEKLAGPLARGPYIRLLALIQFFPVCKAAQKASIINAVLDVYSGRDVGESVKPYQSIKKWRKIWAVLFWVVLAVGIAAISVFAVFFAGDNGKAVEDAQNTAYRADVTYGMMMEKYMPEAKWKSYRAKSDEKGKSVKEGDLIVEAEGKSAMGEEIDLHFVGEPQEQDGDSEMQKFTPYLVKVNGNEMSEAFFMDAVYQCYIGSKLSATEVSQYAVAAAKRMDKYINGRPTGATYGQIIENFVPDPKWDVSIEESDEGITMNVVASGKNTYDKETEFCFRGEKGKGTAKVTEQEMMLNSIIIDGKESNISVMNLLYIYYMDCDSSAYLDAVGMQGDNWLVESDLTGYYMGDRTNPYTLEVSFYSAWDSNSRESGTVEIIDYNEDEVYSGEIIPVDWNVYLLNDKEGNEIYITFYEKYGYYLSAVIVNGELLTEGLVKQE